MDLSGSSFELRINGSKLVIPQAGPDSVAASLKYADLAQHPHAEIGAGIGDSSVTLGAPPVMSRFPGDPVRTAPLPPRAPEDPQKIERIVKDPAQLAIDTALKTGAIRAPTAGNVYFEYSENIKKIKTVSLIAHTPAGDLEIEIR